VAKFKYFSSDDNKSKLRWRFYFMNPGYKSVLNLVPSFLISTNQRLKHT